MTKDRKQLEHIYNEGKILPELDFPFVIRTCVITSKCSHLLGTVCMIGETTRSTFVWTLSGEEICGGD